MKLIRKEKIAQDEEVEAIVVCAPAFEPNNTVFC